MEDSLKKVEKNTPMLLKYVLLIPKFLNLLFNIYKDNRVPNYLKVAVAGVITYVLLPWDVLPDFVPIIGHSDDIIIIFLTILEFLKLCPIEVVEEHWQKSIGETGEITNYINTAIENIKPHLSYRFNLVVSSLGKIFMSYKNFRMKNLSKGCLDKKDSKIITS